MILRRVSALGAALALAGCGSSDAPPAPAGPVGDPLVVPFAARIAGQPFSCTTTYAGIGSTAADVEPLDFRLYVHDVRLLTAAGGEVPATIDDDGVFQNPDVALLDFEDATGTCANGTPETHTSLALHAPAGSYVGLAFRIGVPFADDHGDGDTQPSPLNLSGLYWDWQYGHKFVRIDVRIPGTAADPAADTVFNLHVGSTDCDGGASGGVTACGHENVAEIRLIDFDFSSQKVVLDWADLVAGLDLTLDDGSSPGCMSDDGDAQCATIFPRLGVDASGAPSPDTQVFAHADW